MANTSTTYAYVFLWLSRQNQEVYPSLQRVFLMSLLTFFLQSHIHELSSTSDVVNEHLVPLPSSVSPFILDRTVKVWIWCCEKKKKRFVKRNDKVTNTSGWPDKTKWKETRWKWWTLSTMNMRLYTSMKNTNDFTTSYTSNPADNKLNWLSWECSCWQSMSM